MTMATDIDEAKRSMRREATARRAAMTPPGDAAQRLVENLSNADIVPEGASVSGFWSIGDEIDVRPVLLALAQRGHQIALPVVVRRGQPLVFRTWRQGDEMSEGPFGIREPMSSAREISPVVLLVPLLAFDRKGYRLGYGGGFYDRTLAALRSRGEIVAIGVGWAAQEVPEVPRDGYDQRLDWILTENECSAIAGAHP